MTIGRPSSSSAMRSVAAWQRMQAAFANDPEMAGDEAAIATALAADPHILSPDALLTRVARALTFATSHQREVRTIAAEVRAQTARAVQRVSTVRALAGELLDAFGRDSAQTAFGTLYARSVPPSVIITDCSALPDEYVITEVVRKPNIEALREDLAHGVVIEGATLNNAGRTVALRHASTLLDGSDDKDA